MISPRKLHIAEYITAIQGFSELVYITVATALAVSWNPFTNSKAHAAKRQRTKRIE